MTDLTVPPEAYEAAARAYDEAVNASLGNPAGMVLDADAKAKLVEFPAWRAAIDAAIAVDRPLAVAEGRRQAAAEIRTQAADVAIEGRGFPVALVGPAMAKLAGWIAEWAARVAEGPSVVASSDVLGEDYDRLITERDGLILGGVNPEELAVPLKPIDPGRTHR